MTQGVRPVLSASRRALTAVSAVVMGGLLVACTPSGPDPTPSLTPTVEPTTATPEPEPEPTEVLPEEPVMPMPRTGTPDERDAEAAALYFVELYEYTLTSGDLTTWEARSLDDCVFCANTVETVNGFRGEGGSYHGGVIETEPAQFVDFSDLFVVFAVEVPITVSPAELIDPAGAVVRTFRGGDGYLLLEMGYAPELGWMLSEGDHRDESVS